MTEKLIYLNPHWQQTLTENHLNSFEALWQLEIPTIDEGNQGRGRDGWSHVCIHNLNPEADNPQRIVIKRQSNYRSRTARHPIRGISTFLKEYNFIRRYEELGIPALKAIYCSARQQGREMQVILVSEYLENYHSLAERQKLWEENCSREQRAEDIKIVAQLVARLHSRNLEHRCLYPKHIFINLDHNNRQACLIDLETTRWKPQWFGYSLRDLSTLVRRSNNATNRDYILFLCHYLGIKHLDEKAKQMWKQIELLVKRKQH